MRTDADRAGCRRSRKSTSGDSISRGTHCIKTWSKTQAVIAKSSGESELYGVVRGACESLGTKTLCENLGEALSIILDVDATAAKGIFDRTGLAKVRHIDVKEGRSEKTAKLHSVTRSERQDLAAVKLVYVDDSVASV